MRSIDSVVITVDGASKVGTTTLVDHIVGEALFQASVIPDTLSPDSFWADILDEEHRQYLENLQEAVTFRSVTRVVGGNVFRAATLLVARMEAEGYEVTSFDPSFAEPILEVLAEDGVEDILQHDTAISSRVAEVAKMAGVQALCRTVICDATILAYNANGGSNLVVLDARNPINHLLAGGLIGMEIGQIAPGSILPIYLDAPAEVTAQWMSGDLQANISAIRARRQADATRFENPVTVPERFSKNIDAWRKAIISRGRVGSIVDPIHLENDGTVTLENIQFFASVVAAAAQDVAYYLRNRPESVYAGIGSQSETTTN